MTLTLRALSLNGLPLSQPIQACFDSRGGTIGRADHNTLALPDPQRHISRLQAQISAEGDTFVIRNVGSENPVIVAGKSLQHGESAALADRDQLRIGGYLLEVCDERAAATLARARPDSGERPAPPSGAAASAALAGFADLNAPLAGDPFAGLLGAETGGEPAHARIEGTNDPVSPPLDVAPGPAAFAKTVPAAPRLPGGYDEEFDKTTPAARRSPADSDEFAKTAPAAPRLPAGFGEFAKPGASAHGAAWPAPSDPHAPLGAAPALAAPPGADPTLALQAAFEPTVAAAPLNPEGTTWLRELPGVGKGEAPSSAAATTAELWSAFCAGAGVRSDVSSLDAETMRTIGALLRAAVEGTRRLMAARAVQKQELRAEMTVIRAHDNNPLKFSPDAQTALEMMLRPSLRGFLAGPAAMTDAMRDLAGHAIGTMAGMRAALEGVLDRFAPPALEAKLQQRHVLDNLVPSHRKARLWELYLQHHEAIRGEVQDDFDTLFGRAFLAAYQQQIERLRRDDSEP